MYCTLFRKPGYASHGETTALHQMPDSTSTIGEGSGVGVGERETNIDGGCEDDGVVTPVQASNRPLQAEEPVVAQ